MKRQLIILLLAFTAVAGAQTDNTFYAKQFQGPDVGTKVANALAACSSNALLECYVIIDPSMGSYAPGILPTPCSHCNIIDYRTNPFNGTGIYQVNGVSYSGVSAALTACNGSSEVACVIDDRAGLGTRTLGALAPTKAVSILLSANADYTMTSLTLTSGLEFGGLAAGTNQLSAGGVGTAVKCVGADGSSCIVEPTGNNQAAQHVRISDVTFVANSGNTSQNGMYFDCQSYTNSGVWYSDFTDLVFLGFMGDGIHLNCPTSVSAIQFNSFRNVRAFRPSGGGHDLYAAGSGVGNDDFFNCEFDSFNWSDATATANVWLGASTTPGGNSYSLNFYHLTDQGGALLLQFNGTQNINFYGLHSEGTLDITDGALFTLGGSQNQAISFDNAYFAANIGYGAGGYLFNTQNSNYALALNVTNSTWGVPTNTLIGPVGSSAQSIQFDHNFAGGAPVTSGIAQLYYDAATITSGLQRQIGIDGGATPITTINSNLASGEILETTAIANAVTFGSSGGNLYLPGNASTYVLQPGEGALWSVNDYLGKLQMIGGAVGTGGLPSGCTGSSGGNLNCAGTIVAGTTNPVTIGGATGSCTGLYAKADGTGCGNPGGGSGGGLPLTVVGATITTPGSYTVCPTGITFTGGSGSPAAVAKPVCTPSTGVTGITLDPSLGLSGGSYTSAPSIAFTGGTGSGAAATAVMNLLQSATVFTHPFSFQQAVEGSNYPISTGAESQSLLALGGDAIRYRYDQQNWCVDSVNGSDSNTGYPVGGVGQCTSAVAVQTCAKLTTLNRFPYDVIGMAEGSHWRETCAAIFPGETFMVYGQGPRPMIDATNVLANGSFTLVGGTTNCYQQTGQVIDPGTAEAGLILAFEAGTRLTAVTSTALCDSTPGSFYIPQVTSPVTVYVHASTGIPTTNGLLYEYGSRNFALYDGGIQHVTFIGLGARGSIDDDGSINLGGGYGSAINTYSADSTNHCYYLAEGTLALNAEATDCGDGAFVLHTGNLPGTGAKASCINCYAHEANMAAGLAHSSTGILSHTGGTTNWSSIELINPTVQNETSGIGLSDVDNITIINPQIYVAGVGIQPQSTVSTSIIGGQVNATGYGAQTPYCIKNGTIPTGTGVNVGNSLSVSGTECTGGIYNAAPSQAITISNVNFLGGGYWLQNVTGATSTTWSIHGSTFSTSSHNTYSFTVAPALLLSSENTFGTAPTFQLSSGGGTLSLATWQGLGYDTDAVINSTNVPMVNGLVDNTPIGSVTPSTGAFSVLSAPVMTGSVTVTLTPQTAAGAGATATCNTGYNCTVSSGTFYYHTGSSATAAGAQMVISWATPYLPHNVNCVVSGFNAASIALGPYMSAGSNNNFTMSTLSAPTASSYYYFTYLCGE